MKRRRKLHQATVQNNLNKNVVRLKIFKIENKLFGSVERAILTDFNNIFQEVNFKCSQYCVVNVNHLQLCS